MIVQQKVAVALWVCVALFFISRFVSVLSQFLGLKNTLKVIATVALVYGGSAFLICFTIYAFFFA